MKYLKIITLFSFLVLFSSCEDFFDQTTTIDIPPHTPKLGVTALWIDEGNDMLVTVSSSVGALEDESSSAISDAVVILSENGAQLAIFEEVSTEKGFYRPVSSVELVSGRTYELTVSAANFETVKAEQIMPEKPTLKSAKYVRSNSKLHISISDNEGADFYLIGLTPLTSAMYSNAYVYSEGGIADDSGLDYGRVILRDETFAGEDVSQVFDSYVDSGSSSGQVDSVMVNLYNVTSDYYRFDQTFGAADNADGNPFAEPVILHRNFKKGFGVFALGNRTSVVVPVE